MLGLYRLQEGKILGFRLREDGVYIQNHARGGRRLLEHILLRAPDPAVFHCIKLREKGAFLQELVYGCDSAVHGAVVNEHVAVPCLSKEGFHLHIHSG